MSSDNSIKGFVSRNRTAIIATIAAGTTAVGAYYYYTQLQAQQQENVRPKEDTDKSTATKKEKKKSKGKESKKPQEDTPTTKKPIYLVDSNGEPNLSDIDSLTEETKNEWAMALKDKGNELFKTSKFEDAIKYYHYALKLKDDPIYYSNISACYASLLQYEKVIEYATKALKLRPTFSKVLMRRALAYEAMGNFGDAMFDISACSLNGDMNDASIEPILERILNKQAEFVLKEKISANKEQNLPSSTPLASFFRVFKPETSFANYEESNEADRELMNGLTNLYKNSEEGFQIADKSFLKAAELFKDQLSQNKDNEAIKEKTAIALEYSGILYYMKNETLKAHDSIKSAIELHPRVNSYIYQSLIGSDSTTTSEYLQNFDKALELEPNNPAIYYHRGQSYFIAQQYEKAGKDFDKVKELDENNIFAYIQLACLAYRESKFDDCETLFSEARRKFPTAPEVPNFFAEVLADRGESEKAMKEFDKAIELEAKTPEEIHVGIAPLIGKATLLISKPTVENFVEGIQLLQEACDKDPRSEQARLGLAQLKLQQEDIDEAIQLFEEAAELAKSYEEKLQATTFAEAAKIQKRIRADPAMDAKIRQTIEQMRSQMSM
ncbi:protein channel TOM70 NDAI_0F02810 [Naumovozyma dairenensis CBS 421]|uniref:TOM70 n=1 Tax=Naumovozyma dairenensis (strain ATCC 10597 / BCRC 20456 / CBS 421 / NBRC 0211 / NRRL Y-12639) TaxID=1071378 RepID=G0WCT8_NAUDC|nr:hypothetical protein NDAI_0F02810 [Naumovozyma dairenensis CBS 421]CCD25599.1 hypothetical protein NDAI_0F02810 [Naumovozyma dairenensis CBS 421]